MSQANRTAKAARCTALYAVATLLGGLASSGVRAQTPTPFEGIWYTKDDESIIKVHHCAAADDAFCGTLVWLKEPKEADGTLKVDKLNKDPAKKNKPMVGLDILINMKMDDDHLKGKAYNPEDGKLYDITFKVKTDKEENDTADLRGCVLGFLCQTEIFTRAKEVPGGDPTLTADLGKKHKPKKDAKAPAHR